MKALMLNFPQYHPSGTCDGGLEKSSFLSFSCSWILLCLGCVGWFAGWFADRFVDCWDWELTGSLVNAWLETGFISLAWTASFDFAG